MTGDQVMKFLMTAVAAALLLAACGGEDTTTRDETDEIVEGGEIGVFAVQEGDCISWATDSSEISSFSGVPCDEPHDGEIYELFDIAGFDEFPGDQVIGEQADEGCLAAFEPFIGLEWELSEFFFTRFTPSQETWDGVDDREVICIATPGEGEPQLTMSLEGIAQ